MTLLWISMEWKHGNGMLTAINSTATVVIVNKDFLKEEDDDSLFYPSNHIIYNIVKRVLYIQSISEEQWAANIQCPGTNSPGILASALVRVTDQRTNLSYIFWWVHWLENYANAQIWWWRKPTRALETMHLLEVSYIEERGIKITWKIKDFKFTVHLLVSILVVPLFFTSAEQRAFHYALWVSLRYATYFPQPLMLVVTGLQFTRMTEDGN